MSFRIDRRRPISNPGYRSRAFTLIELLVVLVIIAVISAVALLSLGIVGDDRKLQTEARRLSTLIELANDEAAILGRDYGLELTETGYRFVEFDPLLNRWYELIGDDLLRPRQIEEGMVFDLFLEGRRVLLEFELQNIEPLEIDDEDTEESAQRRDTNTDLTNDYAPHILIMSSGDVSPFELQILRPADRASLTLIMSLTGELEIERDDQDRL
jgi:general secretion pathway protein H